MSDILDKDSKVTSSKDRIDNLFDQMVSLLMATDVTEEEALNVLGKLVVATSVSLNMSSIDIKFKNNSTVAVNIPEEVMEQPLIPAVAAVFKKSSEPTSGADVELTIPNGVPFIHQYPDCVQ